MDTAHWPQEIGMKPMEEMVIQNATNSCSKPSSNPSSLERRARPQKEAAINCPRCNSTNTKFCYYNNYSLSQPRYFCKTCRRYWTEGGSLRNVPVGGGSRKNKRSSSSISSHSSMSKKLPDLVVPPPAPTSLLSQNPRMHHEHGQDLNLGFQSTNDFKTSSELIQVPNFDGSKNSTTSASATTSSSAHQLSALELVTGTTTRGFEAKAEISVPQNQEFQDKICTALKLLTFREPHVLVQFWSSHVVGRRRLLTTLNQPYGFGAIDEDLRVYRNLSELSPYGLDKDDGEDDSSPPARVYRRGLPEWTPDITNYMPKDFPLQECALTCNLKGYLGLPVFDSATGLCIGVLELLTSSKYVEYAYEVKQIQSALETVNLGILPVFGRPTLNVTNERRQNQLDKIHRIQKAMCDKYGLPFAQTWAVSPFSSYVAHERVLEKCCGSFNAKCIGKACMSTTDLPFYVGDMGKWDFMEACRERHLEKSLGLAGRALSSHGSCFCGDVSALSEEEYPLVHNAGLSRLTGCFTIFLRGGDNDEDYVLEFFLPADIKEGRWVLELVQTLEQMIKVNPGFELGDVSSIEVVGSGDFNDLSSDTDFSDLSDSESIMEIPTVELRAAFEMYDIRLPFSVSSGLLELENLVAQRVNLPGQKFVFKYLDDENDLIRIACDADLQYLINCQNDTTVNIIVELADD